MLRTPQASTRMQAAEHDSILDSVLARTGRRTRVSFLLTCDNDNDNRREWTCCQWQIDRNRGEDCSGDKGRKRRGPTTMTKPPRTARIPGSLLVPHPVRRRPRRCQGGHRCPSPLLPVSVDDTAADAPRRGRPGTEQLLSTSLLGVTLLDSVNLSGEVGEVMQRNRDAAQDLLVDTDWLVLAEKSWDALRISGDNPPHRPGPVVASVGPQVRRLLETTVLESLKRAQVRVEVCGHVRRACRPLAASAAHTATTCI